MSTRASDPSNQTSYWHSQHPAPDRVGGSQLPSSVDVAVIGGGIAGLLTAVELRRSGREVAVLEARSVSSGTTGSSTAKVSALQGTSYSRLRRDHGPEAARCYARANLAGLAHVVSTIGRLGIDCGLSTDFASTYVTEADRVELIEEEADAAAEAGLEVRLVDTLDLPLPVLGAVVMEGQAMVDPVALSLGLAEHLAAEDQHVVLGCKVLDVDPGEPCTVHTERGELTASVVVVATQLPTVDPTLLFARAEPTMSYALAARMDRRAPVGLHLSADRSTRSVRAAGPNSNVGIFGGPSHRVGEGGDTTEYAAELAEWVRSSFPVVEVLAEWSAHDVELSDGIPAIGAADDDGRLFVASGFRKWGFTHAGATALLITDALSGTLPDWASLYDPRRAPKGVSALTETAAGNVTVARHFVGDRLRDLTGPNLEDLKPGEAAVVIHDGRATAARRDEAGSYLLLSATCPHLGCRVAWNAHAETWDCPCHGSRFDAEGKLLAGPANRDLGPA